MMLTASRALLFDWGGTLMRDFPEYTGPMADWEQIVCLPNALETLSDLYAGWMIGLATNAADSNETQIWSALNRAGLGAFIDRVYCYHSLSVKKPDPAYFQAVLDRLSLPAESVVMVGDDFDADVCGALQSSLRAVWLNEKTGEFRDGPGYTTIHNLAELPDALSRFI